jgi:hypothetical protein
MDHLCPPLASPHMRLCHLFVGWKCGNMWPARSQREAKHDADCGSLPQAMGMQSPTPCPTMVATVLSGGGTSTAVLGSRSRKYPLLG